MSNSNYSFFQLAKKGINEWWMYLITILLILAGYILGQLPLGMLQLSRIDELGLGSDALETFNKTMDFGIFNIDKNLGLVLMILMFVFALGGLLLGLKMHRKGIKDIITARPKINFNKILFGFGVWFAMTIVFELIMYFTNPTGYNFHFNAGSFIVLLLISLTLLPIQTSMEEFLFRGYLMQGISLLAKNKWVPLIITTILFAAVHGSNPEVEKYGFWTMQVYYISAGLLLGIIVIMDDGLELALGVHAATNIYGVTLVSYEGSVLQTDTLFKTTDLEPWLMNIFFIIMAIIFYIICARKYNWNHPRYIFESVGNNSNLNIEQTQIVSSNIGSTYVAENPIKDVINNLENINQIDSADIVSNTDYSSLIKEDESE